MANQYIIIRDDLLTDPVTVITDGLLIGRLLECEVLLNHPSISRVQAGIKQIDDDYYLFSLRPSNPVILNGKPIEDNEALAPGDVMRVGPFQLDVEETEDALIIRVSLLIGMVASATDVSSGSLSTEHLVLPGPGKKPAKPRPAPIQGTKALDIFWDKRIREAGKMVRPSPLFPRSQKRSGKSQFNWAPTTDLSSRWPGAVFTWSFVLVGLLTLGASYKFAGAYAPAPLSNAHRLTQLTLMPAIAEKANGGSCTSCHSWKGHMTEQCAGCHNTDAFVATMIKPHEEAGVTCIDCHSEHRGVQFKAAEAAFVSCVECHNSRNNRIYNGRHLTTPHGGTFGYPVVAGHWSLKAINEDDWATRNIPISRLPDDTEEKWRSKQFHALHSERVRTIPGIAGNELGQMSCSSCHKSFTPVDRETPRTTCGQCHNGRTDPSSKRVLIAADAPNCTSCHVQHVKDQRRWGTEMLWKAASN
jgi:pSer/pThr/pTyr-binding forkhead associated (FHA) protein